MAEVTITKLVPMAKHGAGIKIGGVKITQLDLREEWMKKSVKEPIICGACGTYYRYTESAGLEVLENT